MGLVLKPEARALRGLVRSILADPVQRREMFASCIVATQAREGINTTIAQAERAYDAVMQEQEKAKRWIIERTAGKDI